MKLSIVEVERFVCVRQGGRCTPTAQQDGMAHQYEQLPSYVRAEIAKRTDAERALKKYTSAAAQRFAEADSCNRQALNFAEFCAALPPRMMRKLPTSDIQMVFDEADVNKDDRLSIHE